jgi:hypothetical protein
VCVVGVAVAVVVGVVLGSFDIVDFGSVVLLSLPCVCALCKSFFKYCHACHLFACTQVAAIASGGQTAASVHTPKLLQQVQLGVAGWAWCVEASK